VLALTPHSVVSAPYHRLSGGLVAAHTILYGTPAEAQRVAMRYKVTYVALCGRHASTDVEPPAGSLWTELQAGRVPPWLTPAAAPTDPTSFSVYRLR
jgi:hypothetical protein